MNNEDEQPLSMKTPKGGRMIAKKSLKMSVQVRAMTELRVNTRDEMVHGELNRLYINV
jgi:hypothetical protein